MFDFNAARAADEDIIVEEGRGSLPATQVFVAEDREHCYTGVYWLRIPPGV